MFWKGAVGEKAEEGKGSERGKEMWGGGRLLLGRARTVTAGAGVRVVRAALEGQGMSDKDFKQLSMSCVDLNPSRDLSLPPQCFRKVCS